MSELLALKVADNTYPAGALSQKHISGCSAILSRAEAEES